MEMRPAKGRADIILGRERFRCSRCGAKAAAYFNIDNLEDPRAVARSVNSYFNPSIVTSLCVDGLVTILYLFK